LNRPRGPAGQLDGLHPTTKGIAISKFQKFRAFVTRIFKNSLFLYQMQNRDRKKAAQQEGLRRLSQQIHFLDGDAALTSRPKFVTLRPQKAHFRLQTPA
jgi:hypothetical protein